MKCNFWLFDFKIEVREVKVRKVDAKLNMADSSDDLPIMYQNAFSGTQDASLNRKKLRSVAVAQQ